ncbi:MAG TPA: hypothetical protein DEB31_06660 [Clostridiales bacterium]|nr:hypothetical protein [Clostridiales bacterium]
MKRLFFVLALLLMIALPAQALAVNVPADGSYTVGVTLSGGSGRASVESPAKLQIEGGSMAATIIWSSPNYTYMELGGVKYNPVNTEGNSTFEIPVAALDADIAVNAETVAMSEPHVVEYTLRFGASTLKSQNAGAGQTAPVIIAIAAAIAAVILIAALRRRKKNTKKR